MKKAIIIFLIVIAIISLWTFDTSFVTNAEGGQASGTSAVIFAKADYLSVRVKFIIIPQAGTWINITHPDGAQEKIAVATSYVYEVFLPKTGNAPNGFAENAPGGLLIYSNKPCRATVVANATESFINSLGSYSSDSVDIYWLRIDGKARVTVASYGVSI